MHRQSFSSLSVPRLVISFPRDSADLEKKCPAVPGSCKTLLPSLGCLCQNASGDIVYGLGSWIVPVQTVVEYVMELGRWETCSFDKKTVLGLASLGC